jgi:hypothetical protein
MMSSDQDGFTGIDPTEPGVHFHNGSAYRDDECLCSLSPLHEDDDD